MSSGKLNKCRFTFQIKYKHIKPMTLLPPCSTVKIIINIFKKYKYKLKMNENIENFHIYCCNFIQYSFLF